MIQINWNEFKDFKKHSHREDNFSILLDFIKSYYNMINPVDVYETLVFDETAKMMLEKRDISDPEGLEKYLFKIVNG